MTKVSGIKSNEYYSVQTVNPYRKIATIENFTWFPLFDFKHDFSSTMIKSGIYVIGLKFTPYMEPQPIYIGCSKDLDGRMEQHKRSNSISKYLKGVYRFFPNECLYVRFILVEGKSNYKALETRLIASTIGTLNVIERDNESIAISEERARASLNEMVKVYRHLVRKYREDFC